MNGNEILIDTNIAIYYLKGDVAVRQYFHDNFPLISFITELEMLSGGDFTIDESADIKKFLSRQTTFEYLPDFKEIIIDIRSQKRLKLPDAIIAATAIYLDVPLVSADKGFKSISGLNFIYHDPAAN